MNNQESQKSQTTEQQHKPFNSASKNSFDKDDFKTQGKKGLQDKEEHNAGSKISSEEEGSDFKAQRPDTENNKKDGAIASTAQATTSHKETRA